MNHTALKNTAQELSTQASFLVEIKDNDEYQQALALMEELIDDYDNQQVLIELLTGSIKRWEDESDDFSEFNARIKSGDPAISILRLLMDQHNLGVADLPEIGSKSLVSKILNQHRQLTREHIDLLSKRFNISPALFF
jgi:HTH-type transcriptional regulator/antitoxin HigA